MLSREWEERIKIIISEAVGLLERGIANIGLRREEEKRSFVSDTGEE